MGNFFKLATACIHSVVALWSWEIQILTVCHRTLNCLCLLWYSTMVSVGCSVRSYVCADFLSTRKGSPLHPPYRPPLWICHSKDWVHKDIELEKWGNQQPGLWIWGPKFQQRPKQHRSKDWQTEDQELRHLGLEERRTQRFEDWWSGDLRIQRIVGCVSLVF